MESLCGSAVPCGLVETCLSRQPASSSLVKAPLFWSRCSGGRELPPMLFSYPQRYRRRWKALACDASDDSGEDGSDNGSSVNWLTILTSSPPFLESGLDSDDHASSMSEQMKMVIPSTSKSGTTGSKTGLFRTPISGGVQTATSANDLPRPALAVRNLMEQAKFGQLCTVMSRMHHRRAGYPVGSLVDFVSDSVGHPIFSLSPLAIHTRNLLVNPKCSLVVQIPGWSSLSNARVTIFGDMFPLSAEEQEWACQQFLAKHQQWSFQEWGNFYYYRMQNISDIYFIGGFGTVAWVDVKEYEALKPDKITADSGEQNLKELNAIFSKPLKEMLSTKAEIDDAAFISVDSKGTDVRVRQGAQFNIQRISFEVEHEVQTLDEAKAALENIITKHSRSISPNGS
ncbi:hypothetical protein Cni_G27817 [Canna indica]|uniref:CREG-like beta-barrel domain-containing protein n=1 Tax=Canna indica TaxID=4628 RepID=A0AAQ3QSL8_9LILI|nr:hypothetical protein Cni_G27817 [Canna indica]